MKRFFVLFAVIFAIFLDAGDGFCEKPEKEGQVAAVQERIFHRHHELSLGAGYIPDDDFYYLFPVSLGYTFSLNERWAWEVVRGSWLASMDKDLKGDLERDFGVTPTYFSKPEYAFHSNILYKFLYGKSVIGESTVLNHETYALFGGGVLVYEKRFSDSPPVSEVAPSLSLGIGHKIFLTQNLCLNIELRDWINFRPDETTNNFQVGLSLGFRFNLSARKTPRDETAERVKKYLE